MSTGTNHQAPGSIEVSILARVLGNEQGQLPLAMARYVLSLGFGVDEKARMHELTVRNQANALSDAEREELFAYVKVGSLLSILKSRARQAIKAKKRKQA